MLAAVTFLGQPTDLHSPHRRRLADALIAARRVKALTGQVAGDRS